MTAANWPFFEAMHKALGKRDSDVAEDPDVVASTSAPGPSTTLCLSEVFSVL